MFEDPPAHGSLFLFSFAKDPVVFDKENVPQLYSHITIRSVQVATGHERILSVEKEESCGSVLGSHPRPSVR